MASVTVRIPTQLRSLTGGESSVIVEGENVGLVLKEVQTNYEGIGERIFDESGSLRRFVNVFYGDEDIRFLENLDTIVADGATISIVPAVAGG